MGAVTGHFALYATYAEGARQAIDLERHLDRADLFIQMDLAVSRPDYAHSFEASVSDFLNANLDQYECHVLFLDPGQGWRQLVGLCPSGDGNHRVLVMVVDNHAGTCLPVYAGHEAGRQHQLIEQMAWMLGLQPILSFPCLNDRLRQFLLSLGLRHGWVLESVSCPALAHVTESLHHRRSIAWVQTSGFQHLASTVHEWPDYLVHHTSLDTVNPAAWDSLVLVSDQKIPDDIATKHQDKMVVWRPKSLVIGISCHRETPLEVVGQGLVQFLDDNGLSIDSVRYLASIDLKRHHPALNDFGIIHDIPLLTYGIDELLNADPGRPEAQQRRLWQTERFSVAEAAARYCSGTSALLLPESTFHLEAGGPSVNMAACRIPNSDTQVVSAHTPAGHQIVICSGSQCSRGGSCHRLADRVRRLAKELRLDQGCRQIRIASSVCCVACRYKSSAVIHETLAAHEPQVNEGVRLRGVHSFSFTLWRQILMAVGHRKPLNNLLSSSQLVPLDKEQTLLILPNPGITGHNTELPAE